MCIAKVIFSREMCTEGGRRPSGGWRATSAKRIWLSGYLLEQTFSQRLKRRRGASI